LVGLVGLRVAAALVGAWLSAGVESPELCLSIDTEGGLLEG
jgi:hypothetical protein